MRAVYWRETVSRRPFAAGRVWGWEQVIATDLSVLRGLPAFLLVFFQVVVTKNPPETVLDRGTQERKTSDVCAHWKKSALLEHEPWLGTARWFHAD
jgi:hypothetical protein